jgi:hypothetical protein
MILFIYFFRNLFSLNFSLCLLVGKVDEKKRNKKLLWTTSFFRSFYFFGLLDPDEKKSSFQVS